jgi:hypothetical protein
MLEKGKGKTQTPVRDPKGQNKSNPEPQVDPAPKVPAKEAGAKATVPAHLARAVATAPLAFRNPTLIN